MPVSTSATFEAAPTAVWAIISDFKNLMRWHPLVVSCETKGDGEGAVRRVEFADWWAEERLDLLDPSKFTLTYSVLDCSRAPAIGVKGSMTLTDLGNGNTRLDWVSGHQDDHPQATAVNAGLEQYYPVRIGHLRAALGLPPA